MQSVLYSVKFVVSHHPLYSIYGQRQLTMDGIFETFICIQTFLCLPGEQKHLFSSQYINPLCSFVYFCFEDTVPKSSFESITP